MGRARPASSARAYALYTLAAVVSIFLVRSFIQETKGKELEDMQG